MGIWLIARGSGTKITHPWPLKMLNVLQTNKAIWIEARWMMDYAFFSFSSGSMMLLRMPKRKKKEQHHHANSRSIKIVQIKGQQIRISTQALILVMASISTIMIKWPKTESNLAETPRISIHKNNSGFANRRCSKRGRNRLTRITLICNKYTRISRIKSNLSIKIQGKSHRDEILIIRRHNNMHLRTRSPK